ncbi:MAG: PP2C family protein-serine/threonine phosphatase, partial [Deltaproteobacteria bacterium]|nr:PP2C family protein-serine/threonine phosphatase [Deltaproteobacteria bacterium]
AFPDHTEFEIYAAMEPARQVGGDFYDFFLVDKDRLCLAIGDVSGKGVPAAFFMAVTRFLVRNLAREGLDPAELLSHLNRELVDDNNACMFVTVFCAILDIETGELIYSSGGHEPAMLLRKGLEVELLKAPGGPVVGLMENVSFKMDKVVLSRGDTLFTYTDGVTEAVDSTGQFFTRDRLRDTVLSSGCKTAQGVIETLSQVLTAFAQGAAQADDITMMALKFEGRGSEPSDGDRSL